MNFNAVPHAEVPANKPGFETHYYTIQQLSEILSFSFERTRLLIKDEPGVLRFTSNSAGNRRTRTMYRIPESVVERILRRNTNPPKAA